MANGSITHASVRDRRPVTRATIASVTSADINRVNASAWTVAFEKLNCGIHRQMPATSKAAPSSSRVSRAIA
jgi:hypothetical protein